MKIILFDGATEPIYEQIKKQIKMAILGGEIQEGDMLPSIRTLAKDLKVSVITTTRAYSDLEQEGFVKSIQGKGSFVLPRNLALFKESLLQEVEECIVKGIEKAHLAQLTEQEFRRLVEGLIKERYDG